MFIYEVSARIKTLSGVSNAAHDSNLQPEVSLQYSICSNGMYVILPFQQ